MRDLAEQAVACWRGAAGDGSIEVKASGGNGVVLRAEREIPLAVKLSPVDDRERGQREFEALTALAGTGLAPEPFDLVVEPSGAPVTALITSWVDGGSPAATWPAVQRTAELLARVHAREVPSVRPAFPAPDSVSLLGRGKRRLGELPSEVAAPLAADADRLSTWAAKPAPLRLTHGDPSPENLLLTDSGLVLVDWEYAGAGDPALDHAYLCTHPKLLDVFADHPDRCDELAETLGGTQFALAASVYYWIVIHEILLRVPQPRLKGAQQRDPDALRRQVSRYRAWFLRLAS